MDYSTGTKHLYALVSANMLTVLSVWVLGYKMAIYALKKSLTNWLKQRFYC